MKTTVPDDDRPLSDTSVSLQLSLIQRRISELMQSEEEGGGLSLVDEDTEPKHGAIDPYNHNRSFGRKRR